MEVSKYIMLFHKKLKGEIDQQEQRELSDWLQGESPDGFAEGIEHAWNLSKRYKEGYEPDVDAGLARLQARIAASREPENSAARRRPRPSRRPLPWLQAAAAVALLAALGWWWIGTGTATSDTDAALFTSGPDEPKELTLPDGSAVLLNVNSFLTVQAGFRDGPERRVELAGEAYFNVRHDPSRPFRITAGSAMVEVLGTAFNLRSYPAENYTEVEVQEGIVRLSGLQSGQAAELAAGFRGALRPGQPIDYQKSPGLNAQSWRTQRLAFRNTPLNEALACLERHFNVELKLSNGELADCGITMEFEDFTLSEVFKAFELIFNLQVQEMGDVYWLKGGRCGKAEE